MNPKVSLVAVDRFAEFVLVTFSDDRLALLPNEELYARSLTPQEFGLDLSTEGDEDNPDDLSRRCERS